MTQFSYGGDQLLTEYDNAGHLLRRYVPGANGADDPLVWYEGSGTTDRRWLITDQQGSVVGVTNASGTLINGTANTYDEYGIPGSSNQGRFQYTGQIWIPELALYHYKARTYSPTLGRFMQTDPIGYDAGLNLYAYVGGDPVNQLDPSGLANCPVGDPNCIETPESAKQPGQPPPKSDETTTVEEVVVTAQKKKKDSNDKPIRFGDGTEHGYIVTDKIEQAKLRAIGSQNCGNGISVEIFGLSAPAGSTRAHTHPDSYGAPGQIPGPGDGGAARSSSIGTAFVMTSRNVFTIESFANGTFRTTVASGPPLSGSQISDLQGNMQNWENPQSSGSGRQNYCGR